MGEEIFQWKREGEQGFTIDDAIKEAQRCLHCPKPLCQTGCPIQNEIPDFIRAIAEGNFGEAATIIGHRSNLPAICGRICPKEKQCEGACIMNKAKKPPIQIGYLESFVADFIGDKIQNKKTYIPPKGQKVAVIGSGPAGLAVAEDMAKAGYEVTVFEAKGEPGGLLVAGIPEFRLAKRLVRRKVDDIRALGVTFQCNTTIGQDISIEQIMEQGFEAVFIGIGAGIPWNLDIAGIKRQGVYMSMQILRAIQKVINKGQDPITLSRALGQWDGEESERPMTTLPEEEEATFFYSIGANSRAIDYSMDGVSQRYGYTAGYKAEKATPSEEMDSLLGIEINHKAINTEILTQSRTEEAEEGAMAALRDCADGEATVMSQMPTEEQAASMLSKLNLPIKAGDKMLIVGAGNVAMDVARSSRRMGLDVTIVFRRSREKMECLPSEYEAAIAEGVKFKYCLQPVEVVGEGNVKALRCERIEILRDGSAVSSGYFETLPADIVVISIGHKPDREAYETMGLAMGEERQHFNQLETHKEPISCDASGYILTEKEPYYGMTTKEGVFAGGDIVHRPATVVMAMREGKKVARSMCAFLEANKEKNG